LRDGPLPLPQAGEGIYIGYDIAET
jgi:hypothetical protein